MTGITIINKSLQSADALASAEMKSTSEKIGKFRGGLTGWSVGLMAVLVLLFGLLGSAQPAAAALVCTVDVDGANDPPGDGQKDVTQFCQEDGPGGAGFELFAKWNWDDITHNTGTSDGCVLFDTNADGFVDNAVCVTITGSAPFTPVVIAYDCDNDKNDNCSGATPIASPTSNCSVAITNDDPFDNAAPGGPGDAYPQDTEAFCNIEIDDFSGATSLGVVNVCSYPSASPQSNASDCVLFTECMTDADCSDGNACDGAEMCVQNTCEEGTPLSCDDGSVCTGAETCDPTDGCQPGTPLVCTDGDVCTGIEMCDPTNGCQAGTPLVCDDGSVCTGDETCDPTNGCQAGTPLVCTDGDVCTGDETCDPTNGCQAGTPLVCTDGSVCTGEETCDPTNGCQPGTPLVCTDGDVCTGDETCDPTNGCQAGTPLVCTDGSVCTGEETCDPTNGCQPGTPLVCDDGSVCTGDETCDPTNGCQPGTPLVCADGEFCNGDETCDPTSGCQPGIPVVCTGDDCNLGMCDEANDNCALTPTNAGGTCGDQMDTACTDPDTCDANGFCQPNNEACAAVTNSALCEFDFSPKGICAIGGVAIDMSGSEILGDNQSTVGCSADADCVQYGGDTCIDENQFRLQFTPDGKQWPAHKISNTNPGQFFYNAIVARTEPQTCENDLCSFTGNACTIATVETDCPEPQPMCDPGTDRETLEIRIPYPFVTQGAQPVHVYDGSLTNTGPDAEDFLCFVPPDQALDSFGAVLTAEDWHDGGVAPAVPAPSGPDWEWECDVPNIDLDGPPEQQGFCTLTLTDLEFPDSCQLYVNVHLDYAWKGPQTDLNPRDGNTDRYNPDTIVGPSPWGTYNMLQKGTLFSAVTDCTDYNFSHVEETTLTGFGDRIQNLNVVKKPAGVFGLVETSSTEEGVSGVPLSLIHPANGVVGTGQTDEDGFYLVDYKHKGKATIYTVQLEDGSLLKGAVTLKGNGFSEINFDLTTGTASSPGDDGSGGGGGKGGGPKK